MGANTAKKPASSKAYKIAVATCTQKNTQGQPHLHLNPDRGRFRPSATASEDLEHPSSGGDVRTWKTLSDARPSCRKQPLRRIAAALYCARGASHGPAPSAALPAALSSHSAASPASAGPRKHREDLRASACAGVARTERSWRFCCCCCFTCWGAADRAGVHTTKP